MDEQQYEYRTGRTDPDKSNRGLIAALLICVIFLGGLVSALSFMNIHLFRELKNARENAPLSFSQAEATAQPAENALVLAGMALQEPDPVYQQLHGLPEGLYVVRVEPGGQAEKLGIQPGDVVLSMENTPVTSLETAKNLLNTRSDASICLLLSRNGSEISLTITQ